MFFELKGTSLSCKTAFSLEGGFELEEMGENDCLLEVAPPEAVRGHQKLISTSQMTHVLIHH